MLRALRARGATGLVRVRFRRNRITILSLTRNGTSLNVHEGFRDADGAVLDALAVFASAGGRRTRACRRALRTLRAWPGLEPALRHARAAAPGAAARPRRLPRVGPDCATPEQAHYLRQLYERLDRGLFQGRLPPVPLRLSNRMSRRLGHIRKERTGDERRVVELALNVDLMLEENDALRLDVMIHEMAHVAAWLFDGEGGHGTAWKRRARRAGCEAKACTGVPAARRPGGARTVSRVPPLPDLADTAAA